MRRILALLAVMGLCVPVMGGAVVVRRVAVGGGGTDLLNGETFNATGYDLGAWTAFTDGSPIVDPDETVLCPLDTGFSSQCLQTTPSANNEHYGSAYALSAPQGGAVYCRAYLNIKATTGLDNGESIIIAANSASGTSIDATTSQFRLRLQNTLGTFELVGRCYQANFGTTTVVAGTTYLVEWYSNRSLATDACDMKIAGIQKGPQDANIPFGDDVTHITVGNATTEVQQVSMVWDSVACSSAGWVGGL
jgi:hypothetical protein